PRPRALHAGEERLGGFESVGHPRRALVRADGLKSAPPPTTEGNSVQLLGNCVQYRAHELLVADERKPFERGVDRCLSVPRPSSSECWLFPVSWVSSPPRHRAACRARCKAISLVVPATSAARCSMTS